LMPLLLTFAGISAAILRTSVNMRGLSEQLAVEGKDDRDSQPKRKPDATLLSRMGKTRWSGFCRLAAGPGLLVVVVVALGMSVRELYVASVAQDEVNWLRRQRKRQLLVDLPSLSGRLKRLEDVALSNSHNAIIWQAVGEFRLAEQQRLGAESLFRLQPASVDSHASWLSTKTFRHACYSSEKAISFEACLLPTQSADQYREARQDFIKALLLNPLDPFSRISLLELDMVAPDANLASRDLLLQTARLRSRSDSFLRYLLWFATDYPGRDSLPEISVMRDALAQEREREGGE